MKKHLMLSRLFCVVLLVLEVMPGGAVLCFKTDEERIRSVFSCFDLTVFGNANFAPFITSLLTVALLILLTVIAFKDTRSLRVSAFFISSFASFISLTPLFYGFDYMTGISFCISLILLCTSVLLFICARYSEKQ